MREEIKKQDETMVDEISTEKAEATEEVSAEPVESVEAEIVKEEEPEVENVVEAEILSEESTTAASANFSSTSENACNVNAEKIDDAVPFENQYMNQNTTQNTTNVSAIVGLCLGTAGVILNFIQPFIGVVAGIVGIVFSVKGRKVQEGRGMATTGLVLSIIAVVIFGVMILFSILVVGAVLGGAIGIFGL